MVKLSETSKERLQIVFEAGKTIFHYGFIPTILYLGKILLFSSINTYVFFFLGFKKGAEEGMPPLSFASLLWQ